MTRIVFLGTPGAAVPTLEALASRHPVVAVLTRPDRPRGRSNRPRPSPVKEKAAELGIPVHTPEDHHEMAAALALHAPLDLAVVVAYGRLIRPEALGLPRHGMLNVHFSLLPRWRGAAPVARAILAGDPMTGVTIIRLDPGLDTGPVLTAQAVDIGVEETAGELTERLSRLGAALLAGVVRPYAEGRIVPVPQSEEGASYAPKVSKAERPLDPTGPRGDALRRVRALSPEPGATLEVDGSVMQVLTARPYDSSPPPGKWRRGGRAPVVGFSDGGIELVEVKPAGRKAMTGEAWLLGRRSQSGSVR